MQYNDVGTYCTPTSKGTKVVIQHVWEMWGVEHGQKEYEPRIAHHAPTSTVKTSNYSLRHASLVSGMLFLL